MSSVTQSQDETIVGLMAMGFDLKDCQDAINFGKTSVEAAVEWKTRVSSDFNNRAAAPFQKPHPIPEASQSEPSKSTTDQSETPMSISSTSQSETVSSDTGQSDSDMPFPRREFTIEEMSRTLADLGLTPTGSLVIQKRQIHSRAMEMGGRDERENDGQPEGEEMLEEHGHGMPPPAGLGFGGAMDEMLGGLGVGANNQAFGGTGQRLVAEGHQGFRTDFHDRPARELAVERAQARQAAPPPAALGPQQGPSSGPLGPPSLSQVHSLAQMCLKNVANRLNDPRHQLLSLAGISEEMAQIILEFLIKEKLLKPKTLNAFIPW
ncbi:hypothetical protein MAR_006968 [Mya arenaria]|uniref:UBA domain-containing protein n=1 Tax=Mya arenaria TaxID=6604 RepID=A0ABY7DA20_MYAAR|nr:hypothetical protein MAR_006968 [Mya arenaria]